MTILENFPLKDILYYKIGGKARFVLKVQGKEDVLQALDFIEKNNIKKTLAVGLGAKLLVTDDFFDGAVIWFAKPDKNSIKQNPDGLIETFAGETLDDLIQFSLSKNLVGLEWAGGLPSTLGGAVKGNSGAFGKTIGEIIEKVETCDLQTHKWTTLTNKDLKFSYRNSLIKEHKNLLVATVFFKLAKADEKEIVKAKDYYLSRINYRKENHPMDFSSCGSVFKNIEKENEIKIILSKWPDLKKMVENEWLEKVSMGYIMQKLGFAGFQVGGAKVSEKQANFIVNFNQAKFDDVMVIIDRIKEKFFQTFGFYPELEVDVIK